jgi:putative methyltransferase
VSIIDPGLNTQNLILLYTLPDRPTLLAVSKSINLLHTERRTFPAKPPSGAPSSKNLTLVLLHDLLFSREAKIQASDKWPPKAALMRHATRVKAELVKLQVRKGLGKKEELERDGGSVAGEGPWRRICSRLAARKI